jgi:hypothetical protein
MYSLIGQYLKKRFYYPISVFLSNALRLPAPKQQKMAAADAGQLDVEPKKRLATVEDYDLKQLLTEKDAEYQASHRFSCTYI